MKRIALLIFGTLLLPGAAHGEEAKSKWPLLEVGVMPEIGIRGIKLTSPVEPVEEHQLSKNSAASGFVLSAGYRTERLLVAGFGEFAWTIGKEQTNSLGTLGVLARYKLISVFALEPRVFGTNWRHECECDPANFRGLGGGMNLVFSLAKDWGKDDVAFPQFVIGGDASYLGSRRDAAGLTSVSAYAWSVSLGLRLSVLTRLGFD